MMTIGWIDSIFDYQRKARDEFVAGNYTKALAELDDVINVAQFAIESINAGGPEMTPAEIAEFKALMAVQRTRPSAKRTRLLAAWEDALLELPPNHPRRLANPGVKVADDPDGMAPALGGEGA